MNLKLIILFVAGFLIINSCQEDTEIVCETINQACGEKTIYKDFEDDNTFFDEINSTITIETIGGSKILKVVEEGNSSLSQIFTDQTPDNLLTLGCELFYDVKFETTGFNNNYNRSIIIKGIDNGFTRNATFVLNSQNLLTNGSDFKTIRIPLELATENGGLPANEIGEWTLENGSTDPVLYFNTLIQNNTLGISFQIDGDTDTNPANNLTWYFDNFIFKKCCEY